MAQDSEQREKAQSGERNAWMARFVHSRFGGLPKGFGVLWAGTLVNRAGTFVAPFLTIYLTEYHQLAVSAITPILVGYGAGVMLSSPLGGVLADRIGRRRTMVVGLLAAAICQLLLALVRGVLLIGIVVFLLGLVGDVFRPAAQATVADVVPEKDQARAFGLLHWALNLAAPVAALGAGWLATRSWTTLFLIDALSSLTFAALVQTRLPRTPAKPEGGDPQSPTSPRRWSGALVGVCLLTLAVFFTYFQTSYVVPANLLDSGLQPEDYGIMMAVNGAFVAVVQPLAGPWLTRIPKRHAIGTGALLIGVGLGSTGLAHTLPLVLVTVVVWSLGEIAVAALLPSLVADLAPAESRGRYMGAFGASIGAAGVMAPLGIALYHANSSLVWWLCLTLGGAAWPGVVVLTKTVGVRGGKLAGAGQPPAEVGEVS
ncbi:MFS transporter [Streptomyces sp. NPDC046984]|uniref:MDR family MFS transporter n=1 Tax=Streptomyces sp. NPDC046984 TaxID=3155138 RepID=UPI0033BFE744